MYQERTYQSQPQTQSQRQYQGQGQVKRLPYREWDERQQQRFPDSPLAQYDPEHRERPSQFGYQRTTKPECGSGRTAAFCHCGGCALTVCYHQSFPHELDHGTIGGSPHLARTDGALPCLSGIEHEYRPIPRRLAAQWWDAG